MEPDTIPQDIQELRIVAQSKLDAAKAVRDRAAAGSAAFAAAAAEARADAERAKRASNPAMQAIRPPG